MRCIVYIDLNMVRAGVVSHPSEWPHGGYNEIQSPRRKNVIIAYDKLRQLAGFPDYRAFASAHRKWVDDLLARNEDKRDCRWTESIAVGGIQFTKRIQTAMGAMAKGRTVHVAKEGFELRESQLGYNAVFSTQNRNIAPENA